MPEVQFVPLGLLFFFSLELNEQETILYLYYYSMMQPFLLRNIFILEQYLFFSYYKKRRDHSFILCNITAKARYQKSITQRGWIILDANDINE